MSWFLSKLFGGGAGEPGPGSGDVSGGDSGDEFGDESVGAEAGGGAPAAVMAAARGSLGLYDPGTDEVRVRLPDAVIRVVEAEDGAYCVQVLRARGGSPALDVEIVSRPRFTHDPAAHAVVWNMAVDGAVKSWRFDVADGSRGPEEREFVRALVRAQTATARGVAFEKAVGKKEVDHDFVYQTSATRGAASRAAAYRDSDGDDGDEKDDEEMEDMDEYSDAPAGGARSSVRSRGWGRRVTSEPAFSAGSGERNQAMAVGMANNRTFVARGAKIGVFRHDDDDRLVEVAEIPKARALDGAFFSPSKVMLHELDRRLLMLNPEEQDRVYCMDLERGQIVEEWEVGDGQKVRSMAPVEKYAQRTGESTLTGTSNNAVFTLDPRLRGGAKKAAMQTYAKAPRFSALAATDEGQTAIGSETGEIRLYNDIAKRAKTLLPGLGDAITGMDVTADGRWILATTDTYLLVAPTEMEDGTNGFDKPMGSKARPRPIKLQLHPQDLARHNIMSVRFTAAHFNIGERVDEHWIVTSTGPYIITWNFARVKRGKVWDYRIKAARQDVVADQFRFNKADEVVVAGVSDVLVEKRRSRRSTKR